MQRRGRSSVKIIVENCVYMNGGDSAINFALRDIVLATFPEAELSFADSGAPAIAPYYPDITFIPLPSFKMDETFVVRLSKKLFGPYRKHLLVRTL